MTGPGVSRVRIVSLLPELLGTYGDGGNALVLQRRLEWRGIPAEVVTIEAGTPVPSSGDVYLLGGGEDGPQEQAARELVTNGGLHRAVANGATVLAICAGMQILGHRFPGRDGSVHEGLGLLDCETVRVDRARAVGELLTGPAMLPDSGGLAPHPLGNLTGFENHAGRTVPGPSARTLGAVEKGEGNGDGSEGVVNGRVVGTYLHGPVLARNPLLADALLRWAVGELPALDGAGDESVAMGIDHEIDQLRRERIAAARAGELAPRRSWRDALRRS